jgi:pimeloyl-ACP methyl ester carboxylesterase
MRFAKVSLATGPRLHYADQGDPTGRPVVFLHGWPDSWFSFSSVAALLPTKYRALMMDQRGFGDSDRPDDGYAIESFADDVVAFLDALSIDRATVVGHSFGSFVARRVAIAHPRRVDRLALIGTGWRGSNPVVREVFASLNDLSDPVPQEFARAFQASTAYAPLPESFFNRIVAESLKLPARLWREVLAAVIAYDDVNELGAIKAPACLMWGDRDALFPREDQDRLSAAIPGIEPRIYPDIGHCPNWECPETVAEDLLAFISKP